MFFFLQVMTSTFYGDKRRYVGSECYIHEKSDKVILKVKNKLREVSFNDLKVHKSFLL